MVRAVLNRQTQQARKGISHSSNMFGDQINILKGNWQLIGRHSLGSFYIISLSCFEAQTQVAGIC